MTSHMKKIFFGFAFAICAVLAASSPAKADVVIWQDAHTGAVVSYPDTWVIASNQDPDDIITIKPRSGRAEAQCRLRMRSDGRNTIYPVRFQDEFQQVNYSAQFWDAYFREFKNPDIKQMYDGAGIGRAFAGFAIANYTAEVPGPKMLRRGVAFAGNHFGELYIFECSCHRDAFAKWKAQFLSVAGSVQMPKKYNEVMTGNYRNFLDEGVPPLKFRGKSAVQRMHY